MCPTPSTRRSFLQSDAAVAANDVDFNSFESDCGPLYPIMFIDTDSFDIPEPVGQTLAEVLFEQMDKRGYEVIVLDELEPASCIMSDIEIVKACYNPKTS